MELRTDVLDWNNLCDAWVRVADNRGAPGVDGVSIARFARNWEENLRRLRELVLANRYRPAKLRRIAIPKRIGGQRLLGIPCVGDRVLQRAVLNVLDDVFERRFLDCSYGYRVGRGLRDAVGCILEHRDRGRTWVLDADIDECFDSLDNQLLLEFMAEEVDDPLVMRLIQSWLRVGRRYRNPDRGIALGMPISPLFCNVYLHRLDWALVRRRWSPVRYADDLVVCCVIRRQAEQARQVTASILDGLRLKLEPTKTQITSFDQGFEFLGVRFQGDTYSFTWEGKRFEVEGPTPHWIWGYVPSEYE
jgi:group II intron reverse transcriptase/maturase